MTKFEHTARLARMAYGYWTRQLRPGYMPIRMWVELTNACNLKCTMCPPQSSGAKVKRGFMEFSLFKKIIDEAKNFVYDINLHHTGESLLHPEIIEMIRYAKQAGIYTRLHTNATLLNEKKAKGILDAELDFLSFSFDGYDKETYESIRRGANFEKTLENILNFLYLKKDQEKQRPFTFFEVIDFSGKTDDIARQQAFKRQFKGLPLDKFVVKAPHNWGGTYDIGENPIQPEKYCACTFPWYALVVFWNGKVSPCPQDSFNNLCLGNLNDSSIREIWHGKPLVNIREKMKYKKYQDLNPCVTCDLLYRDSFLGIPTSHLKNFVRESLGK
jgi:radical SAM protein with 4Fe4S-binding SPASM domain